MSAASRAAEQPDKDRHGVRETDRQAGSRAADRQAGSRAAEQTDKQAAEQSRQTRKAEICLISLILVLTCRTIRCMHPDTCSSIQARSCWTTVEVVLKHS